MTKTTVSITVDQIAKLSQWFHISPASLIP
jgi:hypothetical protein